MKTFAILATGILAATTAPAFAHTLSHAEIEAREQAQLRAIEQGRQDGSITWREGLKLRSEQQRIKQFEEAYEADGRLSRSERANLTALQTQAHRDIVAEKNGDAPPLHFHTEGPFPSVPSVAGRAEPPPARRVLALLLPPPPPGSHFRRG